MTELQKQVCAAALYANGYSRPQVGVALDEPEYRVQELVRAGGRVQADGAMGKMQSSTFASTDPEVTYTGWHGSGDGWDGRRPEEG